MKLSPDELLLLLEGLYLIKERDAQVIALIDKLELEYENS